MKNKLPQAPKSPLKFWSIVLGVPVVFVLVVLFMFLYQGSTKDIVSVANQFQPGEGWKLESESVVPPKIVCLDGVACPSINRVWETNDSLTGEYIHDLVKKWTSEDIVVDSDCIDSREVNRICSTSGSKGGYSLQIYTEAMSDTVNNISLFIQKN